MSGPALHARLVQMLDPRPGARVADLGCGRGATLVALGKQRGLRAVVAVERNAVSLATAQGAVGRGPFSWVLADLDRRLPLADKSLDGVVCHNVLECLRDRAGFLDEVHRVLRPGGRLVIGHADFDTLVWHSSSPELTRRMIRHYADSLQPWMGSVDGQMGRKLPSLVAASRLRVEAVEPIVLWSLKPGDGVHDFAPDVAAQARGSTAFAPLELDGWLQDLAARAASGSYLFSLNSYAVLATRP